MTRPAVPGRDSDDTGPESRTGPTGRLVRVLRDRREEILAEWEAAVRELPGARALPGPFLRDHIPALLAKLEEALAEAAHGRAGPAPDLEAAIHGSLRAEAGFDLAEVVAEYAELRACIGRAFAGQLEPNAEEQAALGEMHAVLDRAISAAVQQFVGARERVLQALDAISTAGLEIDDLDDLLRRFLEALRQTTTAADTLTLLLREGDVLRVYATVGLEQAVDAGFTLRIGEGFAGSIAADRRPRSLRSAWTDPIVKSPFLREKGVRALFGVPLIAGSDEVIGVAHVGSLSTDEFSPQDKRIFTVIAARAGAALHRQLLRRRAESAHRDMERALADAARSEARFRAAFNHAAVGMAHLDLEGRFLLVNARYCDILGRRPEDLLGTSVLDLAAPEDAERERRERDRLFAEQRSSYQIFKRLARGDGTHVWVQETVTLVPAGAGDSAYLLDVINDVSERVRAVEQLRARERDLATAVRRRDEVLAIVSHDLRNALQAITMGEQVLLRSSWSADAEQRIQTHGERVLRSARQMQHIIRDLLDATSIESGKLSIRLADCDVDALVAEAVDTHQSQAHARSVQLEAVGQPAATTLRCDRSRVLQALGNLLGNAIKFTPAGGTVEVTTTQRTDAVEIAVHDSGPGVATEDQERIFQAYWQTEGRERPRGGLGLGLAITRGIAEAHGGRVWVESSTGRGSTFVLRIPRT